MVVFASFEDAAYLRKGNLNGVVFVDLLSRMLSNRFLMFIPRFLLTRLLPCGKHRLR